VRLSEKTLTKYVAKGLLTSAEKVALIGTAARIGFRGCLTHSLDWLDDHGFKDAKRRFKPLLGGAPNPHFPKGEIYLCRHVHSEKHHRPGRRGKRCKQLRLSAQRKAELEEQFGRQLPAGYCREHVLQRAGLKVEVQNHKAPKCGKPIRGRMHGRKTKESGRPCRNPCVARRDQDGNTIGYYGACKKHGGMGPLYVKDRKPKPGTRMEKYLARRLRAKMRRQEREQALKDRDWHERSLEADRRMGIGTDRPRIRSPFDERQEEVTRRRPKPWIPYGT
jgi:hypothetical protein